MCYVGNRVYDLNITINPLKTQNHNIFRKQFIYNKHTHDAILKFLLNDIKIHNFKISDITNDIADVRTEKETNKIRLLFL